MISIRALLALAGSCLPALAPAASATPPVVVDDADLGRAVTEARARFLSRQPFDRFDVTVLAEDEGGTWRRGSVGGDRLGYPASCVKLPYLVAAVHWCAERDRAPDCLDADVRPMIEVSDNVATGRVVDAISGAPNVEPADAPGYDAWLTKRFYAQRVLHAKGLLGTQRLFNKTWPTNSGEEPLGFEYRAWREFGRNAMNPDDGARLMLAIETGTLEPQAQDYMQSLLERSAFDGQSSFGRGLPAGTRYRSKLGSAYDTLEEIVAFRLPDGRRFVVAAFSNGYVADDPEPHDVGTLGSFVEDLLDVLPSQHPRAWRAIVAAPDTPRGWMRRLRPGSHAEPPGTLESDAANASYTLEVKVPGPGRYTVAAWYPAAAGQTPRASYTLDAAGVAAAPAVDIDQRHWHARWLPLGEVDVPGTELAVTIRNAASGTLAVDAFRVTACVAEGCGLR